MTRTIWGIVVCDVMSVLCVAGAVYRRELSIGLTFAAIAVGLSYALFKVWRIRR